MEADFKLIVITPENIFADEAERIAMLLNSGCIWRVHIRHPHSSIADIGAILSELPESMHSRISLHDCYELAERYPGLGVHLNARNALSKAPSAGLKSISCHSIGEVAQSECDYVTLSPIYDSISKSGYKSAFNLDDADLRQALTTKSVIALGGVTPEHFSALKDAGFAGAAMLGYVWPKDLAEFKQRLYVIKDNLCCNS
jgi:thiamine-phosphate pyrophosphorylase